MGVCNRHVLRILGKSTPLKVFFDDNLTGGDIELFLAYNKLVESADRVIEAYAKSPKPAQLWFHQVLLQLPWLSPQMRRAIKVELSGGVREYERQLKHSETQVLRWLVNEAKARMRKNGERPKGGIHDAAIDEVSDQVGKRSGDALRKQLQRHK
jgi:hypothetical protein